ncbi:hypothetical protein KCP75_06640 [Salmonella enterica subsp. enterica]|nr:hypothetical protein KCP75_06640 [Salmonella enterica subsp. enterica]
MAIISAKYLPDNPNQYASKENSQEAHRNDPSFRRCAWRSLKDMGADARSYQLVASVCRLTR